MSSPTDGFISDIPSPLSYEKPNLPAMKAEGAKWVAKGIVWSFVVTLTVLLIGGFTVVILLIVRGGFQTKGDKDAIHDWVLPLIQGVAGFASSVFGPLLAFILGYYFGEKAAAKEEG